MYQNKKEVSHPIPVPEELDKAVQTLLWCRKVTGAIQGTPDGALKEWVLSEMDSLCGNQPSMMVENQKRIQSLEKQIQAYTEKIRKLESVSACKPTVEKVYLDSYVPLWGTRIRWFILSSVFWFIVLLTLRS